jgi:hypothetical protein
MRSRRTVVGRDAKPGSPLDDPGAAEPADSRGYLVPGASADCADAALPLVGGMFQKPRPAASPAKAGLPLVPEQALNQLPPVHVLALQRGRFVQRNPSLSSTGKGTKRNRPELRARVPPPAMARAFFLLSLPGPKPRKDVCDVPGDFPVVQNEGPPRGGKKTKGPAMLARSG